MLADTVYLNAQQTNLSLTFGDYIALADLGDAAELQGNRPIYPIFQLQPSQRHRCGSESQFLPSGFAFVLLAASWRWSDLPRRQDRWPCFHSTKKSFG